MEKLDPMMNPASRRPHIIHTLPGRVRIHLPCWPIGEPRQIEARLLQTRGVHGVRANQLTSNVLIHFDPRTTCPSALADALCAVDGHAVLTHYNPGGGTHPAEGEECTRTRPPAAYAAAHPAQRSGAVGGWHATPSLRRTNRKVGAALRRALPSRRAIGILKIAFALGQTSGQYLAVGEERSLSARVLFTPGNALAVVRGVPWAWLGLERFLGNDLAEFLLRRTEAVLKLFCGGLPGILAGCLEGLLLLAEVLS